MQGKERLSQIFALKTFDRNHAVKKRSFRPTVIFFSLFFASILFFVDCSNLYTVFRTILYLITEHIDIYSNWLLAWIYKDNASAPLSVISAFLLLFFLLSPLLFSYIFLSNFVTEFSHFLTTGHSELSLNKEKCFHLTSRIFTGEVIGTGTVQS